MSVQHSHGRLIAILQRTKSFKFKSNFMFWIMQFYQYTVFQGASGGPMKHASRVVFHLRLFEIEIPGLVVSNARVVCSISSRSSTRRPTSNQKCQYSSITKQVFQINVTFFKTGINVSRQKTKKKWCNQKFKNENRRQLIYTSEGATDKWMTAREETN